MVLPNINNTNKSSNKFQN